MGHRGQWTDADADWLHSYTKSEGYADLAEHYQARGIAWTETLAAACGRSS
jgi:hypothetical protein